MSDVVKTISSSKRLEEFKKVLDSQISSLESFLKQIKIEIRPMLMVKFSDIIKSAKKKLLNKKGIRKDDLDAAMDELVFIASEFKKWDDWSNNKRDAYLQLIRGVQSTWKDIVELEVLVQLAERWYEVYYDIDSIYAKTLSLSNKIMWKKLESYESMYDQQRRGVADDSSMRQIANLGNTLLRNISDSLFQISELLKLLPEKLSKIRSYMQDGFYLDYTLQTPRRFDDTIEQKLLDFYNGFFRDLKALPLFVKKDS